MYNIDGRELEITQRKLGLNGNLDISRGLSVNFKIINTSSSYKFVLYYNNYSLDQMVFLIGWYNTIIHVLIQQCAAALNKLV